MFVIGLGLVAGCSGGGSGDSGRTTVAFCSEARKLQGELRGITPTDPLLIAKTIESYRALEKVAPSEIDRDLTVVIDALDKFQQGDAGKLTAPKVQAASERLRAFGKDKCGISNG